MTTPTDWRALCSIAIELWDADCDVESVISQMREALAQPDAPLLPSTMTQSEQQAVIGWVEQHINTNKALRSWRDPTRKGLLMAEVHTVQPGDRARAAMAQPATEPPAPVDLSHLSDEQFNALAPQGYHGVGDCHPELELEGPTVMDIIALAEEIEAEELGQVDLVRRALTRWGCPAIEPVPVSERLPGPEDCDAEGQVWAWHDYDPENDDNGDHWVLIRADWITTVNLWRYWLPHHALPVPTTRREENLDA